jgi:LPS sulfotransferase NodH
MGSLFHKLRHLRRCYVVWVIPCSGSNLLTGGLHATRRAARPKQFLLCKSELDFAALNLARV